MHGIIFKELKDFVIDQYDQATWNAIVDEAGVPSGLYVPVSEYPDEELLALVAAASELSGIPVDDLLYEFGRFVFPDLASVYGVHVDDEWDAVDLVANVEHYIHEALRAKQLSEFTPPGLQSKRVGEDRVLLAYSSDRELCDVAKGLLVGAGEFYDDPVAVREHRCMKDGAPRCEISVERTTGQSRVVN